MVDITGFDEVMAPERSTIVYDFPAKGMRKAVKVIWQDGIRFGGGSAFLRPPGLPADLDMDHSTGGGQAFVGTEGVLYVGDPYGGMTPRLYRKGVEVRVEPVAEVYERIQGGPTQELCRAVRGEGSKPVSNFEDHAGPLTEMVLAGNLALRMGRKIDWDSANLEARGLPEAGKWIHRVYRDGWKPQLG